MIIQLNKRELKKWYRGIIPRIIDKIEEIRFKRIINRFEMTDATDYGKTRT